MENIATIDISKMSPEDKAALEAIAKKYEAEEETTQDDVQKEPELNLEKIKKLRVENKITLAKMAELIGVQFPTYQKKENGDLRFNLIEAKRLADYFGKTIEELFFEEESSEIESQ